MNFREVLRGFAAMAVRNEVTRADVLMLADVYEEEGRGQESLWLRHVACIKFSHHHDPDDYIDYDYMPGQVSMDSVMKVTDRVAIVDRLTEEFREALR